MLACLLCTLDRHTHWYTETLQWVVLDCHTCGVPMAVWHEHSEDIPEDQKTAMLEELARIADLQLGEGRWWLDSIRRMIPDHPHWHARPPWW